MYVVVDFGLFPSNFSFIVSLSKPIMTSVPPVSTLMCQIIWGYEKHFTTIGKAYRKKTPITFVVINLLNFSQIITHLYTLYFRLKKKCIQIISIELRV